ncbi:MAG: hypothetical protein FJ138_09940, partial [Deltaproteobacteria bacterium]|nr:hypothetical protein [Deltaproteobacteria bacterium]
MRFEFKCEACAKSWALPYERIKDRVLKVRCRECQHLNVVRAPELTPSPPP